MTFSIAGTFDPFACNRLARISALRYDNHELAIWEILMVEVKIKPGKYGSAIAMFLYAGEGFQTRFEHTLLVTADQRRRLEEAGFVAKNGKDSKTGRRRGEKEQAGSHL